MVTLPGSHLRGNSARTKYLQTAHPGMVCHIERVLRAVHVLNKFARIVSLCLYSPLTMILPSRQPLLQLQGISKSFPGCIANDAIDLSINCGEIHALLGENGAGKSTLVKIIYGILKADAGIMHWQGSRVAVDNPAAARRLGIAMVFQHFSLFESLTVLENIALGIGEKSGLKQLEQRVVEMSERYGLPLDPRRHVHRLSVGERQRIEIIRCLLQNPKLLVMDEPTSVLTPQEVEKLFHTLRRLAAEGTAILYISHKLSEIKALCGSATILRQARCVATANPQQETTRSLAALMMGSELVRPESKQLTVSTVQRLKVSGLDMPVVDNLTVALRNINFSINAGEILGIAGVAGNGQTELLAAMSGEIMSRDPAAIVLNDTASGCLNASQRRDLGLCCVPEERLGHGAIPPMSLEENTFLTAHRRMRLLRAGFVKFAGRKRFTQAIIASYAVKCTGSTAVASSLSGGNLQKFIIGREILQQPDVLVVSQPTWGVDAGAASAIHQALIDLAKAGSAVLVISQDLDELFTISDRIAAICAGELSTVHVTGEVSIEALGLLMGGVQRAAPAGGNLAI